MKRSNIDLGIRGIKVGDLQRGEREGPELVGPRTRSGACCPALPHIGRAARVIEHDLVLEIQACLWMSARANGSKFVLLAISFSWAHNIFLVNISSVQVGSN